ncbi:MAG: DUF4350 domain-containing protein, partial [Cytophagaceae bacterium]
LLPSLMRQPAVETTRMPVYNLLTEMKLPPRSNYIAVCETFAAGAYDTRELLRYVARGNTAFLSAYSFSDTLSRALGFKADVKNPLKADSTLRSNFVGPALARKGGYNFRHDDGRNFLVVKKPNTAITVLARNARNEAVFLRIPHGKGVFYIHNLPLALTNYYLLSPASSDYMTKALSYLPAQPTYWDEFQKQGRFNEDEQSLLRYIYKQPALTWAYYIGLFGLIIYALFAGKRTQRIIPVVQLPQNTSLEFVKTVGRMYFQQNDHDNVARKKIQYFLADLRERYFLNTQVLDPEFTETLARKSGVPLEETQNLVRMLAQANRAVSLSEFDLLTINFTIENFNAVAASKV